MPAVVPSIEPTSITAGDSHQWTKCLADYPPSEGWTLSYTLILPTSRVVATVADDDVGEYTAVFGADAFGDIVVQTEARLVGTVAGSGSYAGERHVVYDAGLTILPNPTATTMVDARSASEIELVALNAAILALTTTAISAYSIGGRTVTKFDLPTLYQRQAILEAKIRAEKGLGFRRREVAFVNA